MRKTIVAIGGGEIGRIKVYDDGHTEQKPIETMLIDEKIIKLTGKDHPKLVFIGAASGDNPAYYTAVKNHFENRLGARTINLILTKPTDIDIKKTIMDADIIYIGGGNVTDLISVLQKTGVDKMLIDAYNKGIVMSGNSAGGCVWFESYDNDEDEDFDGTQNTLKTKPALGLVKGFFCPHWNKKTTTGIDKDNVSKHAIMQMLCNEQKCGYGVDEGAALMIQTDDQGQTITEIVSKPGAKIYKLLEPKQQHINPGKDRE